MKIEEKTKATKLRKIGKSYGEILKKINVSKGTLSVWLRDVKLTSTQKKRLYVALRRRNAYKGAKILQEKKEEKIRQIIAKAKEEARYLHKNPLFLSGLMLYWAEGDKTEQNPKVKFSNSDPIMIKFMMKWFRDVCKIPENRFRIALHVHELHCRQNIEKYWSNLTKIPLSQFHKTYIKPTSLKHRRNPLYNGTCAIRICDADLFRRIKGWRLGVIEKFKI